MIYLLCYLAVGALFTAVVLLRTPYSNDFDQLALTATGGTDVSDKILAVFLVPLLFCLFVVLAWPLAMRWKVQAMRSDRERRAKEGDVPQRKFDHSEIRLFHPRINGEIVSHEEWNAAHSQRPEVIARNAIKKAIDSAKRSTYKDEH
ncbi:MAG: hypothetical protein D4R79_06480 [Comamonadaceae bacterium]|nr:MAG: hypothetical protein D4R79_06480 [Comamonadaceae bacterium]